MGTYNELIVDGDVMMLDGEELEDVSNIKIEINSRRKEAQVEITRVSFLDCFKFIEEKEAATVKKIFIK